MSPHTVKISEEELITLLLDNPKEGVSYLYDNYSSTLYGVILKIVGSEDVAKDILQDTFIKVWRNFSNYDKSKGRLFTWILNIARNRAIDYTRSKAFKNVQHSESHEPSENSLDEISEINVDNIGLVEVMELLKPEVREVLNIVYFKGYTHHEASEFLKIPLGTVKTRVRNGLMDLRKVIT